MWLLGKGSRYCAKLCFTRLKQENKKKFKKTKSKRWRNNNTLSKKGYTQITLICFWITLSACSSHNGLYGSLLLLLLHFIYYNYTLLYVPPTTINLFASCIPYFYVRPSLWKNNLSLIEFCCPKGNNQLIVCSLLDNKMKKVILINLIIMFRCYVVINVPR